MGRQHFFSWDRPCRRLAVCFCCFVIAWTALPRLRAQTYVRKNNFGVFTEYSNDSSHIVMGWAESRKLLNFGFTYSRALLANRAFDFQYLLEIRPVVLESDPLVRYTVVDTTEIAGNPPQVYVNPPYTLAPVKRCQPGVSSYFYADPYVTETESVEQTCVGRKWTFGEGLSPVGIQFNFLPGHRIQPVFTGLGGYLLSTQPIPVATAGSFNFTFEFGVGVEVYRSGEPEGRFFGRRSIRAEYRYHHISNHDTAAANPGIDSGVLQLTYAFGR